MRVISVFHLVYFCQWEADLGCFSAIIPSSCDQVTHLVGEEKALDVVFLDFSKSFDSVTDSILQEKLTACGLDRCTLLSKELAGELSPESGGEWS